MSDVHALVTEVVRTQQWGRLVEAIPYLRFLGLRVERDGEALRVVMPVADHLIGNPTLPALHGGAIGGLLESTAHLACLAYQAVPPQTLPRTVTLTVDYLRSGKPRDTFVQAKVLKAGRRLMTLQVTAFQEDEGAPIASAAVVLKVG